MSTASPSSLAPGASLHPVKLSRVPAHWSETSALRHQLAALERDVDEYDRLEKKLESLTDEPVWDAMIPLGPLAYFPGQLIHTNDITLTLPSPHPPPSSSLPTPSPSSSATGYLRSAKQARATALADKASVEALVAAVRSELLKAENAARAKAGEDGLEDGWALNEKGEVINEEGLPMFDIREELPLEEEAEQEKAKKPVIKPKDTKPQMRYLIKKGGKQIVRPLKVPTQAATPPTSAPAPAPRAPSPIETIVPDDAPLTASRIDANGILDQLEREEQEEARAAAAADEQDVQRQIAQVDDEPPRPSSSSLTPAGTVKPQPKEFLSAFGSGFLNRGKGKGKAVASSASALAPTSPAPDSSTTSDPPAPVHEPHHHILPAPKSIYRPTPPPSAPNSRPNSPRPDRKVAFEVPATADPKPPKQKRTAILLPPPPPHDIPEAVDAALKPSPSKKEPFVRPIKDLIVERPVRPPSAPKIRAALTPDPSLKTMAKPPKVPVANILERATATPQPFAAPSNAGPVHTLSLSGDKPSGSGEASVHDGMIDEDDYEEPDPSDDGPSLTSDGEDDSDSSGFYGNEDEEDEEELDIDSALHAREVALEYHRQRMNLGAGAGTGPLGGDADPGAYDSWNQPNVPLDATVAGRTPSSGRSSRFRTGRLESAQMIIPTLLAQQVRTDPSADSEDEDGLTADERANIARTLAQLAGEQHAGGPSDLSGQQVLRPTAAAPSISQMLGAEPSVDPGMVRAKAPPAVRPTAVPIAVPANRALDKEEVEEPTEPTPDAVAVAPAKKMSRFKARQLGLE